MTAALRPRSIPTRNRDQVVQDITDFETERAVKLTITPKMAARFLERNKVNRPISGSLLKYLIGQLKADRWIVTGEPLIFSWAGHLLNGQHRLHACVETGIPIECWVVLGIDPEAFKAMDRGKRRSVADDLAIRGETYCHALAAASAVLFYYIQNGMSQFPTNAIDTEDVAEILRDHPGIRDSVVWSEAHKKKVACPGRILAFCHYAFHRKDPATAAKFFDDLASGAGLEKGDPVLKLRDRLFSIATAKAKLPPIEILALVIKTWNYRRAGKPAPSQLRWRSEGYGKEDFPEIA